MLVVIAIIAILTGIVLAMLSGAKVNAKDAVRKVDMNTVKTALEAYATDHGGSYPSTIAPGDSAPKILGVNGCTTETSVASSTWIPGLVQGGYIPQLPHDPDGLSTTLADPTAAANAGCHSTYLYASDGKNYALSNSLVAYSTNPADTSVTVPIIPVDTSTNTTNLNGTGLPGDGSTGTNGTGGTGGSGGTSGVGNSGTGNSSYAVRLNGTSGYIQTPDAFDNHQALTFTAWIKLNSVNSLADSPWII